MVESELTHRASPLIARYRQLAAKATDIKEQMDEIRGIVAGIVDTDGEYKDETGFARFASRKESVKYNGANLDKLVNAWLASTDPIFAQCGKLLAQERSVTPGQRYITIK